ncbi:MFS transporter [Streptomyces sp. 8L]|uniref:MFS transporter n=1 Tax=Streptomyces sp. 8L TaxID=2877242 RepID=UPI001CD7360A|nr:MFS transporter [Streptomyces sp. 8L]MCA1223037.1 MFS transporter [Streptomyces sp. 8L]
MSTPPVEEPPRHANAPAARRRSAARIPGLPRIPGLLRDRAFRRYWSGQGISLLGDQLSSIAIPLIGVLAVHADAAQMGYLTAASWLPNLFFALHAGGWADRRAHRRRVMIAADLGRAALIATVPCAYALHALTLVHLYVVAFAAGTLAVFFDVCDAPLFNALVPPDRYVEGNSLTNGNRAMSQVVGPSVGGVLVQLLSAPLALLGDALSFVASALFLSRIAPAEPPPARGAPGRLAQGRRFIARSPVVRASLGATATVNLFTFMVNALFVLYATTTLGLSPGLLGTVLGAGAVGGLLGAACAGPLAGRIGIGRTFILGCIAYPAPMLLIPAAHGPAPMVVGLLLAAEFGSGVGVMWLDVAVGSILAGGVPDDLRSRVFGAYRTVNYGTRPLGSLAGGALAGSIGLRPTLWIAVAGALTSFLWLLASPVRGLRDVPVTSGTDTPGR